MPQTGGTWSQGSGRGPWGNDARRRFSREWGKRFCKLFRQVVSNIVVNARTNLAALLFYKCAVTFITTFNHWILT